MSDSLAANRQTATKAAAKFEMCAAAYEDADRRSYDALTKVVGGRGWDIPAYRSLGGGDTSVVTAGPVQRPGEPAGPPGPAAPNTWINQAIDKAATVKGYADTAMAQTKYFDEYGKPVLSALAGKAEIVTWDDGKPIYKDTLDSAYAWGNNPKYSPDGEPPSAFDEKLARAEKALERTDPMLAPAKEGQKNWNDLVDRKIGYDNYRPSAETAYVLKSGIDWVGTTQSAYGVVTNPIDTVTSPVTEVYDAGKEMVGSVKDTAALAGAAFGDRKTDTIDWGRS